MSSPQVQRGHAQNRMSVFDANVSHKCMELWHTTMSLILLLYKYNSTSSPRQEQKTILASIFHAITDPPVTKIRLWASLGCKSPLDGEPFKKTYFIFWRFWTQQIGKIFNVCSGSLLQSIGRGRISREGALDLRESWEQRDKFFAEKTENAKIFQNYFGSEAAVFSGEFSFFWPREKGKLTFGGGYNSKTG